MTKKCKFESNCWAGELIRLNGYAHTEDIKQFVKNNPLHIRYHKTSDHKAIEARLIHDFVGIFEELPLLNLLK
ncbi:MAG: hypothetical protein QQN46_07875, partial [Nitrosopumilus sp.]